MSYQQLIESGYMTKTNRVKGLPKGLTYSVKPGVTTATLYDTDIVKVYPTKIVLNVGTWYTRHSMKCINLVLSDLGYKVFQSKNQWYVSCMATNQKVEYHNGIELPHTVGML